MSAIRRLSLLAAALLALVNATTGLPPVWAGNAFLAPRALDDDDDEENEDEAGEDEEEETYLAIVGGAVHTGAGAVLRGATILARNGVIEQIGYDVVVPEDAEVLDAAGMRVYPGMVAIESARNVVSASGGAADEEVLDLHRHVEHVGEVDPTEWIGAFDPRSAAATAIEDSFDPFGRDLVLALATGITSTASSGAAVKLKRGEISDLVMRDGYLRTMSWSSSNPSGKRSLREKLARAAEYRREYAEWQQRGKEREDEKEPSDKGVDKEVLAVLAGDARARFSVNERNDLLSLARLAQEYEFRPVIEGCAEGWTVASELGRAGAAAIVTPRDRRSKDEELVRPGGSTIENAAILHEAGVQVAIIPRDTSINLQGILGRDLMHLPIEVAFAVRGGLPEAAAIEAVTVVPARLLGVAHRIGTLEVGKDCDAIVTDGDLLHYQTFVQYTVVAGKVAYDKQEEIFFAHIRPREERAPVVDPGEEVDPAAEEAAPEATAVEAEDDDEPEDDSGDDDDLPEDDSPEDGEDGR